ncbi:chemotaxis protein CheC [Tenuifilum thalassicum]|uniref:Chemotaxis protein CheC n=2 Tax=Tenuifilum thalassicum TaxID=2590900 RepID=A0A7D3Y4F4_9BACT|nr:chemotaxis protein CheC [Tenuifilum thalassicum]
MKQKLYKRLNRHLNEVAMLTPEQYDSLTELVNIGFSRAANSLSELTGDRIILNVPKVKLTTVSQMEEHLSPKYPGEVSTVHQIFKGEISGDAVLVLDSKSGLKLCDLVAQYEIGHYTEYTTEAIEVLTETGNIIMNSCLGIFGNMLNVHFTFSIPHMSVTSLKAMIQSLISGKNKNDYALLITMSFIMRDSHITGYIIMLMSISSFELLISSLSKLEEN